MDISKKGVIFVSLNKKKTIMAKSFMVDRYGNPYNENESYPCGGGLDKRCSYNKEALHAFYDCKNREDGDNYLKENGFSCIHDDDYSSIWEKGDTKVYYDGYAISMFGYMTTEYVGGVQTMKPKTDVLVDAFIRKEDIEKTMQVLVDNGIAEDEADVVLQAIGYTLLNVELFNK